MTRPPLSVLICLLGATLSMSTSHAAIDREQSRSFYEEALGYFRANRLPEAVIELRNALQQDPKNLPARILLGEALLNDGHPHAAIKEFELALSMGGDENLILVPMARAYLAVLEPKRVITGIVPGGHKSQVDAELHLLQAQAYLVLGDTKLAEKSYASASSLVPTDARPLLGRARIELSNGDRDASDKLLEEALALDANSFDLWLFKAMVHRDFGEYPLALEAFEQALKLRPTSARTLAARAALWMDVGNRAGAKADLEKARELEPDSLETIYLRTLLLFQEGKSEEAKAVLAESAAEIEAIGDDHRSLLPKTKLMLGIVAFFNEDYKEAASKLIEFLKTTPNHLGARRYLGSAYAAMGSWEQVIKVFYTDSLSTLPGDPMILSLLAEAHRARGNHTKAEEYYEAALRLAPNAAGIGVRLAMSRLDAGKPDQALEELTWFAEKLPEFVDVKIQLARLYLKLSRPDDALETARTLVSEFGENARAVNTAGSVFMATGDVTQARKYIKIAKAIDPDFVLAKVNLARLELSQGNAATAAGEYRSILQDYPKDTVAGLELAKLLLRTGEYDEAKERIDKVLDVESDNYDAHVLLLQIFQIRKAPQEKITELAYALPKKFPENPQAEIVAARVSAALGDRETALVAYRRAVEKARFDPSVLVAAAEGQMQILDHSGALWSLNKALQSDPKHLRAGAMKVGVLANLNELDKASEHVSDMFATHGDQSILLTARGRLSLLRKDVESAVSDFKRAHELQGSQATIQAWFKSLVLAGRVEDGTRVLNTWLKQNPNDYASRLLLGDALLRAHELREARVVYEALRKDGVENVVVLNNLAAIYHQLDDERALATAELAFEKAPDLAQVLDTYGWILTERGDPKQGLSILREAYARSSTVPEIRYHIGLALIKLGKKSEARAEIEASLESDANFPGSDKARALLASLKDD